MVLCNSWNSIIFLRTGANDFIYIVVDEAFLSDAPYINPNRDVGFGPDQAHTPLSDDQGSMSLSGTISNIRASYKAGNFGGPYDAADCISMYGPQLLTQRRNLIAVTKPVHGSTRMSPASAFRNVNAPYPTSADTCGSLGDACGSPDNASPPMQPLWNGSSLIAFDFVGVNSGSDWLCTGYDDFNSDPTAHGSAALARKLLSENGTWYLRPDDPEADPESAYPIEYCLSEERVEQNCVLQHVPVLFGLVVACNLVILLCLLATVQTLSKQEDFILATVGDAVVSFFDRPDYHTRNMCLASLSNYRMIIKDGLWKRGLPLPLSYKVSKTRLFSATSKKRWFAAMTVCSTFLSIGVYFLQFSIRSLKPSSVTSTRDIWNLGFGKPNTHAIMETSLTKTFSMFQNILVANVFQLALSITYFLYNSLFTAQCCALEWSRHAKTHQSLRVTVPRGKQNSTWFLHLPFRYGIPLTISLTGLHFLISQSVFITSVQWYWLDGSKDKVNSISTVGYSPLAILCSVCVIAALMLVQGLHSLRPIDSSIPMHGNLSMTISAACHPLLPAGEGKASDSLGDCMPHCGHFGRCASSLEEGPIAAKSLRWGAVRQKSEVAYLNHRFGHCALTAEPVEMPIPGLKYI